MYFFINDSCLCVECPVDQLTFWRCFSSFEKLPSRMHSGSSQRDRTSAELGKVREDFGRSYSAGSRIKIHETSSDVLVQYYDSVYFVQLLLVDRDCGRSGRFVLLLSFLTSVIFLCLLRQSHEGFSLLGRRLLLITERSFRFLFRRGFLASTRIGY
ncbi:hypothetical protein RvY_02511-2 [Ramazzottius varieornatus]|uniref:Uncharacterized protein n=1 Tax=Ramazzottius varieornatus TaxID=947166 RepID=A0A1D1UUH9_RAMVA|nr:hypothetical protein RvY_02511-2 [Ramazzottius varieornatus]